MPALQPGEFLLQHEVGLGWLILFLGAFTNVEITLWLSSPQSGIPLRSLNRSFASSATHLGNSRSILPFPGQDSSTQPLVV